VSSPALRMIAAALCTLSLSACIDSAAPILSEAQPLLGPTFNLQSFSLRKGAAHDPEQAGYAWNGTHYAHASGGMADIKAFSVHPYPPKAGDYIVQSVSDERGGGTEYALAHALVPGVFLVVPIDEDDADEPTRAKYCQRVERAACRIATREQLLAFARATAARPADKGALVLRLPDDTAK
jgi:hypothetical protein